MPSHSQRKRSVVILCPRSSALRDELIKPKDLFKEEMMWWRGDSPVLLKMEKNY